MSTPLAASETVSRPRDVERIVAGRATSDGAGVKLTRVIDQHLQRRLDPFLMLDAFGTDNPDDYIAGFPDHPHRGFETITYMIAGRMRHRDSAPVRDPRPLDQASDSPVGAATRRFTERCSRLETRKPITASTLIRVKT